MIFVALLCCIGSAPPLFTALTTSFLPLVTSTWISITHSEKELRRWILEVRLYRPQCRCRHLSCPPTACPCPTLRCRTVPPRCTKCAKSVCESSQSVPAIHGPIFRTLGESRELRDAPATVNAFTSYFSVCFPMYFCGRYFVTLAPLTRPNLLTPRRECQMQEHGDSRSFSVRRLRHFENTWPHCHFTH